MLNSRQRQEARENGTIQISTSFEWGRFNGNDGFIGIKSTGQSIADHYITILGYQQGRSWFSKKHGRELCGSYNNSTPRKVFGKTYCHEESESDITNFLNEWHKNRPKFWVLDSPVKIKQIVDDVTEEGVCNKCTHITESGVEVAVCSKARWQFGEDGDSRGPCKTRSYFFLFDHDLAQNIVIECGGSNLDRDSLFVKFVNSIEPKDPFEFKVKLVGKEKGTYFQLAVEGISELEPEVKLDMASKADALLARFDSLDRTKEEIEKAKEERAASKTEVSDSEAESLAPEIDDAFEDDDLSIPF